jgi:hypothetical protein
MFVCGCGPDKSRGEISELKKKIGPAKFVEKSVADVVDR